MRKALYIALGLALLATAPVMYGEAVRLGKQATGSLPTAGPNNAGGLMWDTTSQQVKVSDGGAWNAIGPLPSYHAIYITDGGNETIATATPLSPNYAFKVIGDPTNSVAPGVGTWVFTAPYTGYYDVTFQSESTLPACPTLTTTRVFGRVVVSGTAARSYFVREDTDAMCDQVGIGGSVVIYMVAGDTMAPSIVQFTGGSRQAGGDVRDNYIVISYQGP